MEPTLPVSEFKAAPDHSVEEKIASKYGVSCSTQAKKDAPDGSSVELLYCSKGETCTYESDYNEGEEITESPVTGYSIDGEWCTRKYVDYVFLILVSPKDHYSRAYLINSSITISDHGTSWDDHGSEEIIDVTSLPFMDTTGLYVRKFSEDTHSTEHSGGGTEETSSGCMTYLFAGDKHRLVIQWADSEYEYSADYQDEETSISRSYKENYMYYEAGEFKKIESKSARNTAELVDLILHRP